MNEYFYYHQEGSRFGPYYSWQIQELLRSGAIHANAKIEDQAETPYEIGRFIEKFGCATHEELFAFMERRTEDIKSDISRIKWTVRGIGLLFALIYILGVR